MVPIYLILLSFTYLRNSKWGSNPIVSTVAPNFSSRNNTTGSINALVNCIKIQIFDLWACNGVTYNLNTIGPSLNKLVAITIAVSAIDGDYWNYAPSSTNISGDISAFSDSINLEKILLSYYTTITGQVKSLKNLKKLSFLYTVGSAITGSKTDLYNGGTNCTTFRI